MPDPTGSEMLGPAVDGLDAAPAGLQLQLGWTVQFDFDEPPSVRAVGW